MIKSNIHQILLRVGFQYKPAQHIPKESIFLKYDRSKGFYVKSYTISDNIFEVALSIDSDPHIKLPSAYIIDMPEKFKNTLVPHVNFGWYLCYVQQMEGDWDPNDLNSTYIDVDQQIELTLNNSIRSVSEGISTVDPEIEGEFASYWVHDQEAYLLAVPDSKTSNLSCIVTKSRSSQNSQQSIEWIIYADHELDGVPSWLHQRNIELTDVEYICCALFKVAPVHFRTKSWPPEDLKSLLTWLADADSNARRRLLRYLSSKPYTRKHMIVLDIEHQDTIGLLIELNLKALSLKSHNGKNKLVRLASALSGKQSTKTFERFKITKADKNTILNRNTPRSRQGNLNNKKIALIGCGTIGGYSAELLLRSGAGCEGGVFHLYDGDSFGSHNFGRHCLTTAYIGWNKALGLAYSLNSSTHIEKSIEGFNYNFPITAKRLSEYDIIIDATGRPPISKRLAAVVRTLDNDVKPLIIHGFNDGNGRASKVFIDDGSSCYGCLLATPSQYKNNIDLRFLKIDHQSERLISCGSSYTAYDASVSVVTAAMIQEAVLYSLAPTFEWTYNEHMFDGSRSRKPRVLPAHKDCTICND